MTTTQADFASRFELIEDSALPGRRLNVYRVAKNFDRSDWRTWGQMVGFVSLYSGGHCGAYSYAASMGMSPFSLPELAAGWIAKEFRKLPR